MSGAVDGTVFSPGECGVLVAALTTARMARELSRLLHDHEDGRACVSLSAEEQAVEDDLLAKCLRGVDG